MDGRFMIKKSHLMSSQYDNDAFDDLSNELIEKLKYEYNMLQNIKNFSFSENPELRELNHYLDSEIMSLKTVSFGDDQELRELNRYVDDKIKTLRNLKIK